MWTIYVDVLFFTNWIVDFFLLMTVARFAGIHMRLWRACLGATVGAVYAVLMFFPQVQIFYSLPGKLVACFLMTAAAFGGLPAGRFVRVFFLFCLISFGLAGGIMAVSWFSGPGTLEVRNGVLYCHMSLPALILTAAGLYGAVLLFFRLAGKHFASGRKISRVDVTLFGKTVTLSALLDTGNELTDPVTGKKVLVAELSALLPILPEYVSQAASHLSAEKPWLVIEQLASFPEAERFRLIPFTAVGTEKGYVLSVRPQRILVDKKVRNDILVGLYGAPLAGAEGYTALLGV